MRIKGDEIMRRRGFTKGMIAGSVLGAAAAVYLSPIMEQGMKSRSFKRIQRDSQNTFDKVVDLIYDFKNMM